MKKLIYLPFALIVLIAASCGMRNNTKESQAGTETPVVEKDLTALLSIKDTIRAGDSVILNFAVYNKTDSVKQFLKWQTPFEPLLSKYLDIKNEQGEKLQYKGAMAKRMMPPPAAAYLSLNPKDSLSARVDILKGYSLTKPGKYTITYTSENVSGLKVPQSVSFIYK